MFIDHRADSDDRWGRHRADWAALATGPEHFSFGQRPRSWMRDTSMLMRRVLALAVIALLAALAPAASIAGFCSRMPCCAHSSGGGPVFATERGDCCTTVTCEERPSAALVSSASHYDDVSLSSVLVPRAVGPLLRAFPREVNDRIPCASRQRLAVLSILII